MAEFAIFHYHCSTKQIITFFKHTLCAVFVTFLMSSYCFLISYHFGPILKRKLEIHEA